VPTKSLESNYPEVDEGVFRMNQECKHFGPDNTLSDYEMHPPEYDPERKGLRLDENGIIWQDKNKPKIKVPQCRICGAIFI
jgi:stress response protein YsnF